MITKDQAAKLVENEVCKTAECLPEDDEIVLIPEATIEKSWGWVFFYTSKKWLETQDISYALVGNAPFIVERSSGKLIQIGTAHGIEYYIENYERYGNPHA